MELELQAGERIQACEWLLRPRFPASVHRELACSAIDADCRCRLEDSTPDNGPGRRMNRSLSSKLPSPSITAT
jgi:hypothetical protein